jgi:hypothetical protein
MSRALCNGVFACSDAGYKVYKSNKIARLLCEKTTLLIYFSLPRSTRAYSYSVPRDGGHNA